MMGRTARSLYFIFSVSFLIYLAVPNQTFPKPSGKSLQSTEPADVESYLRRGYYNDETRKEVISYYKDVFERFTFGNTGITIPSIRLNYPPEEAQSIIRDQTRSTYLEEIVHPFRQSLFINGFEPKKDSDIIVVDGKKYEQKIIVKMVKSGVSSRIFVGICTLSVFYLIISQWLRLLKTEKYYE